MQYQLICGVILSVFFVRVSSQNLPPIQLDRPDQTECPFIVPVNYFQMENGFNFERMNKNSHSIVYPSSLLKLGISDRLELRMIVEMATHKLENQTISGASPLTVGFKVNITQEKGIIPMISFIGHIGLPKPASKEFQTKYFAPAFRFTMQHTLSQRISLAYNLGAEWDGESAEPTFIYTLTSGLAITKKLGGYAEFFGSFPQNSPSEHRFDGGFTYLATQNIMLDISGGPGLTRNAPRYYISLGFSFRAKVISRIHRNSI